MKTYPAYKESGIEWLGKIPEHWDIIRMQNMGIFSASGIDKKVNPDEPLVSMVNYMDIYGNPSKEISRTRALMQVSCATDKVLSCNLQKGDLVFTPSSETKEDIGLSALITEDLENTVFSYHTIRFRFEREFNHRYRKYLCNNYFVLNQFSRSSKGTTRQILVRDDFNNIKVLVPSLTEQQAIADYLDKKTALIDGLIEKKKRQIELLKEQRQAVINQAVTKGLDPTVEMKDSGIEWLGEIPNHWEVKKLKWIVSKIGSGVTPRGGAEIYQDHGIPLLRSQNVHFDGLRLDDVAYISEEIHQSMKNSHVNGNDVLLNITGASIGRCSVVPANIGEANVNQHVCIMRPMDCVRSYYLHLVMSSNIGQLQVFNSQNGTSREGLNFEQLGNFVIPISNVDEQEKIISKLSETVSGIYKSISQAEKQIELLQEYRTALISEAVTGKIDVRETA